MTFRVFVWRYVCCYGERSSSDLYFMNYVTVHRLLLQKNRQE